MKCNVIASSIINTAIVMWDGCDTDSTNNASTVITDVHAKRPEHVCVIVPKIFSSCQARECFKDVRIEIPFRTIFNDIKLCPGQLSDQIITPISGRKNYARVQYHITIPYIVTLLDSQGKAFELNGYLPETHKDIIMYYEKERSEYDLTLHIDTRSKLLSPAVVDDRSLIISVGSYVITYIERSVQLQIPSFGYY